MSLAKAHSRFLAPSLILLKGKLRIQAENVSRSADLNLKERALANVLIPG